MAFEDFLKTITAKRAGSVFHWISRSITHGISKDRLSFFKDLNEEPELKREVLIALSLIEKDSGIPVERFTHKEIDRYTRRLSQELAERNTHRFDPVTIQEELEQLRRVTT